MPTNTQRIAALEAAIKTLQAQMAEERREFTWATPSIRVVGAPTDGARSFSVRWYRIDPAQPAQPVAVQLDGLPRVTVAEGVAFAQPAVGPGRHALRWFVGGSDYYEVRHAWTVKD